MALPGPARNTQADGALCAVEVERTFGRGGTGALGGAQQLVDGEGQEWNGQLMAEECSSGWRGGRVAFTPEPVQHFVYIEYFIGD